MAVILVVEDEDQVRVLAESLLQTAGHKTLSAASVVQVTAVLATSEPIDLLFTDLRLQDENDAGLSLATKAVGMRPKIKVLYTFGQGVTNGVMTRFVDHSYFVPKPYTGELSMKFGLRPDAQ